MSKFMKIRKIRTFLFSMIGTIILSSCNNGQRSMDRSAAVENTGSEATQVPYTIAKNYFVKNDFDMSKLPTPKITTADTFQKIFGMATVMGADGKPTSIDFAKQFAIAIIPPVDERLIEMKVDNLLKKDDKLILRYKQEIGERQHMQMQAFLLLIVDKAYEGEVIVEKLE